MDFRLPEEFERLLHESLPDYAADALFGAFGSSAAVSVRLNPLKPVSGLKVLEGEKDPVPWCSDAFFLGERKQFTLDPAFHAGAYYVQDSSSMFSHIIKDLIAEAVVNGAVLDLCASPGGKSTHLISLLKDLQPLVVVNEAVGKRVPPLCDNIAKWGASNVLVTNTSAATLGKLEGFFDVILADVPCSGEGMFRKSEDAVSLWSLGNVKECAALQRSIISDIWPSLREGGLLIYSTCTYNHFENTDNVKYIAEELGADIVKDGCQFVPGLVPGEGQFYAVLRKTAPAAKAPKKEKRSSSRYSFIDGNMSVCRSGRQETVPCVFLQDRNSEDIFLLPGSKDLASRMKAVAESLSAFGNYIKMLGCKIGQVKGRKLVLDADLALNCALIGSENAEISLSTAGAGKLSCRIHCAETDAQTALKFLSRENIAPQPEWPQGYMLLKYQNLGLGFVNNLGSRCNNLYPLMRRIRTYNPT
ncbi:MAG: hypothetical protein J6T04_04635 [Bacteroidales bacterium]|nr:hypothetical protein [Bacteroidales bacterium]